MGDVIKFDKTLQQRLEEYEKIFPNGKKSTISHIRKQWGFFLELSIEPDGWQAIWKIPRLTCETLKIDFPCIVLVYVVNINFTELDALVKIIAVQEEIILPEEYVVPLMQLWPTKDQDTSIPLNIHSTSEYLDMYRFFYMYLFMPWDLDEDDSSDWMQKHLVSRLRFYYDLKNGTIPRSIGEHIQSVLTSARRLGARREQIEEQLADRDIDATDVNNERVQALVDINVKLIEIKGEIELLENPLTRNVIIKRQKKLMPTEETSEGKLWVIYKEGSVSTTLDFLNQLKLFYPQETFNFANCIILALREFTHKDTVILNKGCHKIDSAHGLEKGGHLRGIYEPHETILESLTDNIMLDLSGCNVILENITICTKNSKCGVLIRAGKATFKNCNLIGDDKKCSQQGIIVSCGAELNLIDCKIQDFHTAFVGSTGSKIKMENCEIHNVNFGIKMFDNCHFKAKRLMLRDCRKHGFCVETNNVINNSQSVGSFDLLQIVPNVNLQDVNGTNNVKGDVLISRIKKLSPIKDLFSNPDTDPTRKRTSNSESSVEEMEVNEFNNTVIEKPFEEGGDCPK